ncbi:MAG: chemotaxis protein CheW [Clostridia bacterium]|nr:chemotaxis protein CheW [Clostridia bacterium]
MSERFNEIVRDEEDTQQGKVLTFALGGEVFGIEIRYVTEIVGIQKISSIPETPAYVKGIINLRGIIIPVFDMRLRFKKEPAAYTNRTCIIIINIEELAVGLIVDSVAEVAAITDDSIAPMPDLKTGSKTGYIKGICKTDDGIKLLLDCSKLFLSSELEALTQIQQ